MTREERKLKRKQDTKNAIAVLAGLASIVIVVIIAIVLAVSFLLKNIDKTTESTQTTQGETQTQQETETMQESEEPIIDPLMQEAIAVVTGMTLEQKVAQMFIVTPDALTGTKGATVVGNTTKRVFAEYPVGGLIYERNNFQTKEQTQAMLTAMKELSIETVALPIFLGVVEEGGNASVIASKTPIDVANLDDMTKIGATGDNVKAYEAGQTIGTYLSELGFNLNLAPVADVLSNENNSALANRSFGNDSAVVTDMVNGVLDGLAEKNIMGVVKYFPGYGAATGDGTDGAVSTDKTLEELTAFDLVPFKNTIDTRAQFVMVGHVSVPNVTGNNEPSSLSQHMITQLLRNDLKYKGVVMTDAMNKKAITDTYKSADAAVAAILAGADMILMPENFVEAYNGVIEAVRNGVITEEQINTSLVRIVKVKLGMY